LVPEAGLSLAEIDDLVAAGVVRAKSTIEKC
jgi:hypothetical protein